MIDRECDDTIGSGGKCSGSQMLATIRRLAPSKEIERKILFNPRPGLTSGAMGPRCSAIITSASFNPRPGVTSGAICS